MDYETAKGWKGHESVQNVLDDISNLITAKGMGADIVAAFHNDYKSVSEFEAKRGVKVPEDIAALLSRDWS